MQPKPYSHRDKRDTEGKWRETTWGQPNPLPSIYPLSTFSQSVIVEWTQYPVQLDTLQNYFLDRKRWTSCPLIPLWQLRITVSSLLAYLLDIPIARSEPFPIDDLVRDQEERQKGVFSRL